MEAAGCGQAGEASPPQGTYTPLPGRPVGLGQGLVLGRWMGREVENGKGGVVE